MRNCLLFALVALCLRADRITLKNGDRITGEIIKKDGDTLTLKTDHLGTVNMPWAQVSIVQSERPLNVEVDGGRTVRARLETSGEQIELLVPEAPREAVSFSDVIALRNSAEQRSYERLLRPGVLELWTGGATFGLAGAAGNAQTGTLTAALNLARLTRSDKTMTHLNVIRATALVQGVKAETAEAVRGGWSYTRITESPWLFNSFNDFEYDRFQNLDLRFVLGGGAGYAPWRGERGRLEILGGGAYNRESFSETGQRPPFVRNSGEAYFGDDFVYKLNSITSIYQNLRMFPNLTETGEYRLNIDLGVNTQLVRWLTWNVSLSNRYLSNPAPDRKTNDFLYTTGFGVKFGP